MMQKPLNIMVSLGTQCYENLTYVNGAKKYLTTGLFSGNIYGAAILHLYRIL